MASGLTGWLTRFLAVAAVVFLAHGVSRASSCATLPASAFNAAPVYDANNPSQIDPIWYSAFKTTQQNITTYRGGWVVVGDSLANNYGNWQDYAKFSLTHLVDLGVGGDSVPNVMWRWPQYNFSAWKPTVLMIIAGTNNLKTNQTAATTIAQIEALTCKINATLPQTQIILFTVLPRGKRFTLDTDWIATVNAALHSDFDHHYFPLTLIDPDPWIHSQCDPEFAANPNLQMCSLYKDLTHVQDFVYDKFTRMVRARVIQPQADLTVTVTPSARPVAHHGTETFTTVVSNAGPNTATSLDVSQSYTKGLTFVSAASTMGNCQTPAVGAWGTVDCSGFDLPAGGSVTVKLTLYVTAKDGDTLTDTATAVSAVPDEELDDRTATATVTVAN